MPKRKPKEEDFQKVADKYARNSLESIRDDVDALEHAESCEEEGCKVGSETRRVKVTCSTCQGTGKGETGDECVNCKGKKKHFVRQLIHEDPEAWHDRERASERIQEGPLAIAVRSGWYNPGSMDSAPAEYNILLGTGGPAARIIGDLDEHGQPESAHYEYQDWFKPWTRARLRGEEEDVLLKYAQVFYFGN